MTKNKSFLPNAATGTLEREVREGAIAPSIQAYKSASKPLARGNTGQDEAS
ncbi:MAG: hypothetical protein WBA76_17955 [Phormidesmis sp.]